jgi:uncharacterized ferredoxin-like protein
MTIRLNPEPEALVSVAERMCLAARTAPKACGVDNLVTAIVTDEAEKLALATEMRSLAEAIPAAFFARDADCLMAAGPCVIIGTRLERLGIPGCNLCGFEGCAANEQAGARCAYNVGDLGIALGCAASVAADQRADCRIMYTIGLAAVRLGLLGPEVQVAHALPLSATGKNPFFDRK